MDFEKTENGGYQFYVKWLNFPKTSSTWEPEKNIADTQILKEFKW